MPVYVCMLRGINVSGKNKIAMGDLRAGFQSLGFADVATYIQSGNVVFTSDSANAAGLAVEIEQRLETAFNARIPVLLRSADELTRVLAQNPFSAARRDAARLHVTFLGQDPEPVLVEQLAGVESLPDEFAVAGREVYLHCPAGYGNTKLHNTFWERRLKVRATTRNWATVGRLAAMAGGSSIYRRSG